ncbi:MAG: bifunctional diaminohydroxyphosphoribosylaminopyrimidine deaminase/5-amino-6-(5-phosphoribosylamino)uracil reductase RibD [Albidovulum sp.]|nr:bifunctional diaminohydroxyphosphoribosylaminopyrimidine deaminase/5-amino-6-(5-phosphoribosylamino)uracil reductase RibD [Albidovulum sp.]
MRESAADERWMRHALAVGSRGLGIAFPNPSVGCVIVSDGKVAGRGFTSEGGRPHAEANALRAAGNLANGAAAYVTLEPCAHAGQTGSCAKLLADSGIARVVYAIEDPDPRVSGKGAQLLRESGIEVSGGCLSEQARRANLGFFLRIVENRPKIALKLAASLDGKTASAGGQSQWITGAAARRRVHALRATYDAVMVGRGTVEADDPLLTVRDLGSTHSPIRIFFDSDLRTPATNRLAKSARRHALWVAHCEGACPEAAARWNEAGAETIPCARGSDDRVEIRSALREFANRGLTRILCEGGATLAGSLLSADLVDELICFSAGIALGAEGLPAIGRTPWRMLDESPRFELAEQSAAGHDLLHRWRRARPN